MVLIHIPLQLQSAIFRRGPNRTLWLRIKKELSIIVLTLTIYNQSR